MEIFGFGFGFRLGVSFAAIGVFFLKYF